jgi:CHAT domain-containing protein/Tfp pilus assembly protein PilF
MRINKRRYYKLIVTVLLLTTFASAQTLPEVRALEQNKPIECELKGGETHAYSISLTAGQFVSAIVDQRGVDVVVELFGPDGKQLSEFDSPSGTNAPEPVSFVAKSSGAHQIRVRSFEKTAATGFYEIRVEAVRTATPHEKLESEAKELAHIGLVYNQQGDQAKALEYYQRSMTLYQAAGNGGWVARMQNSIGQTLRGQGKYAQAFEAFQKSSTMFEALGDKLALAYTMLDLGYTSELQGKYDAALEYRQKALALGEVLGNKALVALALTQIGWMNFLRGNHLQALEYYRKSLQLREALGYKLDIAQTLNQMSLAYRLQGDFAGALEHGQRALTLSEPLGNKGLTANILMSIGLVYGSRGDLSQALEAYRRSLTFSEEAGDKGLIANALEKIAGINHTQGNFAPALQYYQRSLKLNEESGNKRQIIFGSSAIAWVYRSQGNYAQALEYYQKSLRLSQELGNKYQIASSLNGIGIIYVDQGDFPQALEYFQRSLRLLEETGNAQGLVAINNIGEVYRAQGDYKQALEYYQRSLSLSEKIGSKPGMTETLNNIGEIHLAQANYAQALEYFRRSLALSEELGDRLIMTGTLSGMGSVYVSQSNHLQALEFADRAATIAVQTGNRNQLWNARTTAGRAYRGLNRPAEARQAFEEAISIIESIRTNIAGQEARASYFATVQKPYELYIDALMQLHKQHPSAGNDASALQMSERSRARSLLETLSEAHADIRKGVDPQLLQHERDLQQRLNAVGERQTRLLTGKHTEDQVAAVTKDIYALTSEFQDVQAQIRQRSPRYAALTQPVPLSLKEIQALLDGDTLLLEYALGEEGSYLWAVTPTSISSFELPKRSEIEIAVRSAVGLLSDGKQWTTSDKVESEYAEVAGRLSQMLLAPVAPQLKGKRLLIVGDGALQYLPFGALPSPKSNVQSPTSNGPKARSAVLIPKPLIVEHEIVRLPSASTLSVLRRETANRARPAKSIAVMADPVFERDDERVTANRTVSSQSVASAVTDTNSQTTNSRHLLERAFGLGLSPANDEGGATREILRIPRLPFTRREAEAILATAPASEGLKALDFQASRETAMNPELAQYRIVHFATHGLLNSEHPELSGIVLSLLNEAGEPVDGFLRLHEIYNLNLPADLVVLSACQTGLGKEIRGEGLVGLTRGFMYAGSPRVVASLWKVSDVATAELMKSFYQGMLRQKMRPAAALRAAQVEMWKQKRWQAPFYWAAFELQGEWR